MSIGCAIVASDTSPVKEVITHNQTGRLINFFDLKNLVTQVVDLLQNPTERKRLGMAARDYAIRHYDLETVCLPKQLNWVNELRND